MGKTHLNTLVRSLQGYKDKRKIDGLNNDFSGNRYNLKVMVVLSQKVYVEH